MSLLIKYSILLIIALIGISGQILLKKGLTQFVGLDIKTFFLNLHKILFNPIILTALACYVLGLLAYLFLLSKFELTKLYPVYTACVISGIVLLGSWKLKEPVSWQELIGIAFIVIGVFIVEKFGTPIH